MRLRLVLVLVLVLYCGSGCDGLRLQGSLAVSLIVPAGADKVNVVLRHKSTQSVVIGPIGDTASRQVE